MTPDERIADLAVRALLVEARLTPKPGLVDAANSGAHTDMDLPLLERSAEVLREPFRACAVAGLTGTADAATLTQIGLAGERAMLAATGGVNTHRGALFSLGLLCAGVATVAAPSSGATASSPLCRPNRRTLQAKSMHFAGQIDVPRASGDRPGPAIPGDVPVPSNVAPSAITIAARRDEILAWTATRTGELQARRRATAGDAAHLSHGERALADHGAPGARGEAASGFATVVDHGLPALQRALDDGEDPDDALLAALVALMAHNEDTNLLTRGSAEALSEVRTWAGHLQAAEPGPTQRRAALARANRAFSARRWSPGGSADLLAVTWFLAQPGC